MIRKSTTFAVTALLIGFCPGGARAAEQRTFATPEAAAAAVIDAARNGTREDVLAILGEDLRGRLSTGSPAQDQMEKATILRLADEAVAVKRGDADPNHMIVYLGDVPWPFPVPLVKTGGVWRFDGKAGVEEIENRAIGRNEIGAMSACTMYVTAQIDYASEDRTGEGILQFAQKIRSTPGKHDGLFWSNDRGGELSPLGPFVASAVIEKQTGDKPAPFFGYYYRILTAQGANAMGGARDFLVDGHLLGGFGLVAWPAEHGVTGFTTFVVNHLGQVYEKDLGPQTSEAVKAIVRFDPDSTWKKSGVE
jgi:hypothetical protein